MARLSMQISAALGGKPRFADFIRFHGEGEDIVLKTPEAFAAMYGAVRKQDG